MIFSDVRALCIRKSDKRAKYRDMRGGGWGPKPKYRPGSTILLGSIVNHWQNQAILALV